MSPSWPAAVRARVAPLYENATPPDPCHDLFHVDRVARNAALLAKLEGADADVCVAAAYLHDLDRVGSKDTLADARAHLAAIGAPTEWSGRVLEAVERHKDKSFAPGGKRAMSLEAKVVGDADKLEAIGAIGIARAFSYGGLKGRALWDGADKAGARGALPPVSRDARELLERLAADAAQRPYLSGSTSSTIDHFFEKLLRLQGDFNTESGRRLAAQRHEFLQEFLTQFFDEWHATGP